MVYLEQRPRRSRLIVSRSPDFQDAGIWQVDELLGMSRDDEAPPLLLSELVSATGHVLDSGPVQPGLRFV